MSQNTYTPDSWSDFTLVETAENSLVEPFNPDQVAKKVNDAMVGLGTSIPPVAYLGCTISDNRIGVGLPNPVTQQDIDAALAALNAVCVDPTRNDLTEEQQEAAALAAERALLNTKIDDEQANIESINVEGTGLKDRITGNDDLSVLGINDILKNAVFNATSRTNAQKIEDLRVQLLELADIVKLLLGILARVSHDSVFLLREEKHELDSQ